MRFLFRCKEFFAAATNYNAPAENKPGRGTENKPISFHHAMRAHHHKYLQIHMPQLPVGAYLKAEPPLVTGASSGIGKAIAIALGPLALASALTMLPGRKRPKMP
jgi:hypothetical protein